MGVYNHFQCTEIGCKQVSGYFLQYNTSWGFAAATIGAFPLDLYCLHAQCRQYNAMQWNAMSSMRLWKCLHFCQSHYTVDDENTFVAVLVRVIFLWTLILIKINIHVHVDPGGGGVLRYISDGYVWSPFLGLKFAIWGLFWGLKFCSDFFWVRDFGKDFFGRWQKAKPRVLIFMSNSCIGFIY